jgi:hypothetical protein
VRRKIEENFFPFQFLFPFFSREKSSSLTWIMLTKHRPPSCMKCNSRKMSTVPQISSFHNKKIFPQNKFFFHRWLRSFFVCLGNQFSYDRKTSSSSIFPPLGCWFKPLFGCDESQCSVRRNLKGMKTNYDKFSFTFKFSLFVT